MSTSVLRTSALAFEWPDGTPVFAGLDLEVSAGRHALVGPNGSGKTTLLRLLAGELSPTAGSAATEGRLGYLPQDLTLRTAERVDDRLGVGAVRRALAALDRGEDPAGQLETIGDDWDAEERARAVLDRLGLDPSVLDRTLGELSGGETVQLGLARLLLRSPQVLLLDEPTNNLDRAARDRLVDVVQEWRGTLLLVSHDRALLDGVDRVAELRPARSGPVSVRWYGGNLTDYEAAVSAEQDAAEQSVRAATADVRRQQRDRVRSDQELAKRRRFAQKAFANKREPRAVMRLRKRAAEVSAAKYTDVHDQRLADARGRLDDAEERIRERVDIAVDLPETGVAARQIVLRTPDLVIRTGRTIDLPLDGPERIAIVGGNGTGKTTLLETVAGRVQPLSGQVDVRVPLRLLPQRLDLLDDELSVAANLAVMAPDADVNRVRSRLARFGFRGASADEPVAQLSGGERFRATLAALLLAHPAPRLLLLDEPTNNLDFDSRERLTSALAGYRGALVVASHDQDFLDAVGVHRVLELGSH